MTHHEIEKYTKGARVLHWIHTSAFVILFLTGLVLFIPALGPLAQDSITRIIHRVCAAIFVVIPIIYMLINYAKITIQRKINIGFIFNKPI